MTGTYLFHWLSLKHRTLRDVLDGKPAILVQHGRLLEQNLSRSRLNIQEVMSMLRARGHFSPAEAEFALLETDGELSVLPRSQYRPVQPRDLHISTGYEGLPMQVIQEREPLRQALGKLGLSEDWLADELDRQGTRKDEVFAAWLGTGGKLIVSSCGGEQVH